MEEFRDSAVIIRKGSEAKAKIETSTPNRIIIISFNLLAEISRFRDIKNKTFAMIKTKFRNK